MDLFERIRQELPGLTPGERLAANYILEYPFDVIRDGSATLAEDAGTSRSNVVRFCKKLGFNGYSEFRYEVGRYLNQHKSTVRHTAPQAPDKDGTVLQMYLSAYEKLQNLYQSTQLRQIAAMIRQSRQTLVFGIYHSGYSARQLAFRLGRMQYPAYAIDDPSEMQSFSDLAKPGDLVVIFSVNGRKDYYSCIPDFQQRGAKVVLVTVTPKTSLAQWADQTVVLPCVTRLFSSENLDDAPMFYLFIELLMEALKDLDTE